MKLTFGLGNMRKFLVEAKGKYRKVPFIAILIRWIWADKGCYFKFVKWR